MIAPEYLEEINRGIIDQDYDLPPPDFDAENYPYDDYDRFS
jgi:hypothetical protein